ncbi:hypothetical protein ISN34_07950 [Xanthomonas translucens pv. translucens]|nr:hypothetical protein [Xanthomonas translucens]QSQ46753.1 hypothetical protein ISN34_07950 [Xanthomonas translucens pv. translucens]
MTGVSPKTVVTNSVLPDGRERLMATLADGRILQADDADGMARQLWDAGIRADDVRMPDSREGDVAPAAGTRIRIFGLLRAWALCRAGQRIDHE